MTEIRVSRRGKPRGPLASGPVMVLLIAGMSAGAFGVKYMLDRIAVGSPSVSNLSGELSDVGQLREVTPELTAEETARLNAARLDDDKQREIWQVEHLAFELETHTGKPFRQALASRDFKAVSQFFRPDAEVHTFSEKLEPAIRSAGGVTEARWTASSPDENHGRVDSFVEWLSRATEDFDQIERTRFRVLHLHRDRDHDHDANWAARILVDAVGKSRAGQPLQMESEHDVVFRIPNDEALIAGESITKWSVAFQVERTASQPLLDEVTDQYGLSNLPLIDNWKIDSRLSQQYWFQVAVDDFNLDGYPDIAVASFTGHPLLLRSVAGERFENVTRELELKPWQIDDARLSNLAMWIDYDNDGDPDLFLGRSLYENQNGKALVDVTETSGLRINHHPMGASIADYDCDGRLDIYISYQDVSPEQEQAARRVGWVGDVQSGAENQLWHNEGGGRFRDVTQESRAGGGLGHTFASVWHFQDADHFPDLYIANDFGPNVHLRNRGDGTFEDISATTGAADYATSMGACAGDIDNDGIPELYVANMYSKMGRRVIDHIAPEDYPAGIYEQIRGSCAGNRLYKADGPGRPYRELGADMGINTVGWAYAPTMVDLDGDGFLDIYAATGFMSFNRQKPDG